MQEITGPTAFTKCEKCGAYGWVKPDGTEMADADFAENGYIRYGAILMCRNCGNRAALKNAALRKTDIAMIVDIPTQGLSRVQIDARLRETINVFHKEASRLYGPHGYSLKRVDVPEQSPGQCIILTNPVDSAQALKLQSSLTELWNQIAWRESGAQSVSLKSTSVEQNARPAPRAGKSWWQFWKK